MADELNALRRFWMEVRDCFLRNDAAAFEYDEFLDLGVKLGLLVVEDYEPEGKHEDLELAGDVEEGSPVYVPTDLAKEPQEEPRRG